MTRRMHALFVAGCAVVLALAGPQALATLVEAWHGPYPEPARADAAPLAAAPVPASLDLTLALAPGVHLPR